MRENKNAGYQNAPLATNSHGESYLDYLKGARATWQRVWETDVGTVVQNDFETVTRHYTVDYLSLANRDIMMTEDGSYTERYVYDAAGKRISTELDYAEGTRRGEAGENFQSDFAADTGKVWYRTSLLDSTLFAVDADGEVVAHMIYDAWGNPLVESYTDANLAGLVNRNNYTGYTWDETLGLYFAQNRFYDAELHRFTQEDVIKDGWNWYAYCGNNPVVYVDMYGLVMVAQDYINSGSGTPQIKPQVVNNLTEFGVAHSINIGTMGDNPNPSSGTVVLRNYAMPASADIGRAMLEVQNGGYMEPIKCASYIFYLPEWKGEARRDRRTLAKYYGIKKNQVHIVPIRNNEDLINAWNNMGIEDGKIVNINTVVINTHGKPDKLEYDKNSYDKFTGDMLEELKPRRIENLVLYGCNAGHLSYSNNIAAQFAEITNGAPVIASDGTVYSSWWWTMRYESRGDDSFKDKIANGDVGDSNRASDGWHSFSSVDGNVIISDSLGVKKSIKELLDALNK